MVYEMQYGSFGRGYERHVGAALDVRLGRSALCTDGQLTCFVAQASLDDVVMRAVVNAMHG